MSGLMLGKMLRNNNIGSNDPAKLQAFLPGCVQAKARPVFFNLGNLNWWTLSPRIPQPGLEGALQS